MNKDYKAQVATVFVLAVILVIGLVRSAGWHSSASVGQEPQDTIYAMLGAARTGDTRAYLASFSGPMQATLRQTLAESSEPGFAKYLRDSHAAIKGVAVSDPEKTTQSEAKVRVEYIYQDRNESQLMYLEKGPRGWKISRADSDERVKTLIPYGTPVK